LPAAPPLAVNRDLELGCCEPFDRSAVAIDDLHIDGITSTPERNSCTARAGRLPLSSRRARATREQRARGPLPIGSPRLCGEEPTFGLLLLGSVADLCDAGSIHHAPWLS
jgi:hypothetical protein